MTCTGKLQKWKNIEAEIQVKQLKLVIHVPTMESTREWQKGWTKDGIVKEYRGTVKKYGNGRLAF